MAGRGRCRCRRDEKSCCPLPEGMEAKPLTSSSDFHYLPPSTSYLNHPVTFKFRLLGCRVDDMDRTSGPNRVSAIVLYYHLQPGQWTQHHLHLPTSYAPTDRTWNTRLQPTAYSLQVSWTRHHLISHLARTTCGAAVMDRQNNHHTSVPRCLVGTVRKSRKLH